MSMLLQFEQQYSTLTADITARIGRLSLCSKGERRECIDTVERLLIEVTDLLDQMELSVRELPAGGEKGKYELRVKSYRTDRGLLEKELRSAVRRLRDGASERDDLFDYENGSPGTSGGLTEDHRAVLLKNTESLERTSRKLDESHRITIETQEIGANVLNNLGTQRETLGRARDRLRDAEEDLGQSSKILNNMIRRVIQNRAVLILVAGLLLLGFGIVMYIAFHNS